MISDIDFIKRSLALHLFFARIMKEHSFFLQAGFTAKDNNLISKADTFRRSFDALLADVIALSDGVVSNEVLQSGEVITPYTLKAEEVSSFYTGVEIPTRLTKAEAGLAGDGEARSPLLAQRVFELNNKAIELIKAIIDFKISVLTDVLACKLFTVNYPLLIDHIIREAQLYLMTVQKLQKREEFDLEKEAYEQESFWNRIMAEHSKFIRGLLDPTENELISKANDFGNEFDKLYIRVNQAVNRTIPLKVVTAESLHATKQVKEFNAQGTKGLLECKIKSVILPLLGDHVLRESNHYLRLLKLFEKTT